MTKRSDFRQDFPQKLICNLGFPDDDLDGMLLSIPAIKGADSDKVFFMGWINGLNNQTDEEFTLKYEK